MDKAEDHFLEEALAERQYVDEFYCDRKIVVFERFSKLVEQLDVLVRRIFCHESRCEAFLIPLA